jgi:hypothetical protein
VTVVVSAPVLTNANGYPILGSKRNKLFDIMKIGKKLDTGVGVEPT